MSRNQAEHSNRLSIFWLKKQGYLPRSGWVSGSISWTYGWSENKNSISFSVTTKLQSERDNIRLQYTHTDSWTGEKESLDYQAELVTTSCNFGGERFWFVCPITRNGQHCGRRVGVLYSVGKYFGCRRCGDIAYASQMKGGHFRGCSVTIPDIEQAEKEVKRYYYNGKPTRKYRRLVKMNAKLERDLMLISVGINATKRRFAPKQS